MNRLVIAVLLVATIACGDPSTAPPVPVCPEGSTGRIGDLECRAEELQFDRLYSVTGVITIDDLVPTGFARVRASSDTAVIADRLYSLEGRTNEWGYALLAVTGSAANHAGVVVSETVDLGGCGNHRIDFRLRSSAP